jgi:hypothetical protein
MIYYELKKLEMNQNFSKLLVDTIIESTNKYSIRSSRRTDQIHNMIAKHIECKYPDKVYYKCEYPLKIKTGTHKVDIVIFDKNNHTILFCISFKAPLNNINQNIANYENTKFGEFIKMRTAIPKNAGIIFIDVIPIECPYFKKDDTISRMEKIIPINHKKRTINQLEILRYDDNEQQAHIFSLFVKYEYINKKQIKFSSIENDEDIQRLFEIINSMVNLSMNQP